MNLEDVLSDGGLQQDEWSLTEPTFGEDNQLTVIGWSGKRKSDKYYIFKCALCAKDPELFGEGYFRGLKFSLYPNKIRKQTLPCGCGYFTKWTEDQYKVFCKRKCKLLGMEFIGWDGEYQNSDTKPILKCENHGIFIGAKVKSFVNQTNTKGSCRKCGDELAKLKRTKTTEYFIESFKISGKFQEGTEFYPIGVVEGGTARLWSVYCPACDLTFNSRSGSLQSGKKGCGCNWKTDQTQAYINEIYDEHNCLVGLKFGVSCNPVERNRGINSKTSYSVVLDSVYSFPSVAFCRMAENACKENLVCGTIQKSELPDGWTETTSPENKGKIIEIYTEFGGELFY